VTYRIDWQGVGLALLAFAAGATDVLAFVTLGGVFTSAMTGNLALLGLALGQGRTVGAVDSLVALVGFIIGAAIATAIVERDAKTRGVRGLLVVEVLLLAAFAAVLTWDGRPDPGPALGGLILLSAAAMGIQAVAALQVNVPGVNTVVFTSTLTAIVMTATRTVMRRPKREAWPKAANWQIGTFVVYALGAVSSGVIAWRAPAIIAWPPVAAAVLAAFCNEAAQRRR
jgi:uncharacterized membrane protein YoaK (UPF0700 family)